MRVHPDDLLFFNEVRTAMFRVAKQYDLALRSVEHTANPESGKVFYGQCHTVTGCIEIVVRPTFKGVWAEAPLSPGEVWDTAAHELAHLRHANHGYEFVQFHLELREALSNKQEDHRDKVLRKLVKMQESRDGARQRAQKGDTPAEQQAAQAEAEAFAQAINRMLIENELSPTDIDYARANDMDPVIELTVDLNRYSIEKKKMRVAWQESLARIIARAHLCTFLLVPGSNRIIFVGTKSHATVAEYVYGTLVPIASRMAHTEYCRYWWGLKNSGQSTKEASGFKGSWLIAFTSRIAERFEEARRVAVAESDARLKDRMPSGATSVALIRLNGALVKVQKYVDDKFKSKRGATPLARHYIKNQAGADSGRAAANRMTIGRKGVTGGSGPKGLLS